MRATVVRQAICDSRKRGSRHVRAPVRDIDGTCHRAPWLDADLAAQLATCEDGLPSMWEPASSPEGAARSWRALAGAVLPVPIVW